MVDKANSEVQDKGLNFEQGDMLFLISDLDHYRDSILNEIQSEKWNEKYKLVISNPCIEIWFYYHFKENIPSIDTQGKKERSIPGLMKQHNSTIAKGGINHLLLANITDLEIALKNSKKNFIMEENNIIPSLFSTQMHIVAEKLKEVMT